MVVVLKTETEQSLSRPCLVAMDALGLVKKHNPAIVMAAQVLIFPYYIMLVVYVTYLELLIFTVNCVWGAWNAWETCSVTCGCGTQDRSRAKTQEAENGGNECAGNATETQVCNSALCSGKYFTHKCCKSNNILI